jgi:chemotaxis signal transduction protein
MMSEDVLVFDVAQRRYALPLSQVREVVPRASLAPLPGAPGCLKGLLRLRGDLLPVVDLRAPLGLPAAKARIGQCIVVTSAGATPVGFLVDAVRGIVSGLPAMRDDWQSRKCGPLVRRIGMSSGEILSILDPKAAVGPELEAFLAGILAADDAGDAAGGMPTGKGG